MSLTNLTEQEFAALVKRRDHDQIEQAREGRSFPRKSKRVAPDGVPAAPSPPYRSKWEAAYASKLELEKRAGIIKAYAYENLTFKLAHRQYHRNDFLIWHLDGSIEIAQVKGYHKNIRAGVKGLKWAASLNPWFTWTLKRWTGTGWDSSYVEV
jgi:hypothetical protein